MKLLQFAVALSASLVTSKEALADVIVVNAAGGGDFTQIQAAVDAAVEGDTVLVKPGTYAAFTINAKGLTVVGDVGTIVVPRATVWNTSSAQTVTLANLKGTGTSSSSGFNVLNCAGAVRFVNCDWKGANEGTGVAALGGVVTNSSSVAFAGCTITGGDGALMGNQSCAVGSGNGWDGGHAFHVENSSVALYDTLTRGGKGGNGEAETRPGGWGACLFSGFMFAGRSNITGGAGANPACTFTCPSGGGYGWYLDPVASAWELDCMVSGGLSGIGGDFENCWVETPVPAPAYYDEVPFQFAVPNIGFMSPHIAREGTFVHVKFIGPPGARVFLNDNLTTTFEGVASWRGVLISPFPPSGGPARTIKWGVIPSSGELTRTYPVPQLPPGEEAQTRFLQAYRIGPNGVTLGSFRTLTVLDSAF